MNFRFQNAAVLSLLSGRLPDGGFRQDDDGSGGEDKDEEEAEDTIAALATLEAADESDPTYLLYPPLALRTPRQKRTQIVLLGELVLDMQRAFNRHLDQLHSAKDDCMDKVTRGGCIYLNSTIPNVIGSREKNVVGPFVRTAVETCRVW